jgi:signal transduction histidine kinase
MKPLGKSLGFRLFAVGIVQLVLVACAAWLIGYVVLRLSERTDPRAVASGLKPVLGDHAALEQELRSIRDQHGLLLSAYDSSDRLVATNVVPALSPPRWGQPVGPPPEDDVGPPPPALLPPLGPPPLSFDHRPPYHERGPPPFGGPHHDGRGPGPPPDMYTRLEFPTGGGVLVSRSPHHGPSPLPPLLTLLSGLVVVAVGALLTTRWITRPLGELSRAARALGKGDLSARTNLARADEIGEVGRVFDEMAARMSDLLLAEKELLANLSHELRTPLARIRVALEIAGEGDAEAARTSLSEIAVDLSELESLIGDVLATTRLAVQSRQAAPAGFALHREEISPRGLCERAVERFRAQHGARRLDLFFEDELPRLNADGTLLRRVLDNLLENAHKYSTDPEQPVVLRALAEDGNVVFEVQDRGIGISDEDLPRIFEPFFRSERSRSRGTGGVGLGLTLAKRIVEAHGGRIEVHSQRAVGTTVRAYVPASD